MQRLIKIIVPLLCSLALAEAEQSKAIKEFVLDEHSVYSIPVSGDRVTTVSFPGPISAIDAAQVTDYFKSHIPKALTFFLCVRSRRRR